MLVSNTERRKDFEKNTTTQVISNDLLELSIKTIYTGFKSWNKLKTHDSYRADTILTNLLQEENSNSKPNYMQQCKCTVRYAR